MRVTDRHWLAATLAILIVAMALLFGGFIPSLVAASLAITFRGTRPARSGWLRTCWRRDRCCSASPRPRSWAGGCWARGNVADVHRVLSLLCLIAIGGHTLFLALDQYAAFSFPELFVPFVTWYRPFWTGLGIVSAYLAVTVYLSFYIRPRIGYKVWRAFHYAAFVVFVLGALHGIMAGTDTHERWAVAMYASTICAVVALMAYRIAHRTAPWRAAVLASPGRQLAEAAANPP